MSTMKRKKVCVPGSVMSEGIVTSLDPSSRSGLYEDCPITESTVSKWSVAAPTSIDEKKIAEDVVVVDSEREERRWIFNRSYCETGTADFRWKSVMGKRRSVCSIPQAGTPTRFPATPSILLIFIALLGVCQGCRVEQCWRHYTHNMDSQDITQGPNFAYCTLLKTHSDCIRSTAKSCRGDLKYHSTSSLIMQWMLDNNCSHILVPVENSGTHPVVTKAPRPAPNPACSFHGRNEFQHCALFGDPHLRTFQDEFQTCKVLGAWPLIDNAYLAVQVTNEAVLPESSATATTKVTVIIKGSGGTCAQYKTYEAQVDNVPSAFIDGTSFTGPSDDRYVRIKEKNPAPQSHVEIVIRYISTTIVVRQTGRYLTVAIRMPREVVRQGVSPGAEGMQLCLNGCPAKERIPYKKMLAMPTHKIKTSLGRPEQAVSRSEAVTKCKEYNVTDFYFDSCVFDLMTTGDLSFGEAASKALHDLWRLNPKLAAEQRNRTVLPVSLSPGEEDEGNKSYSHSPIDSLMNSGPGRPTSSFFHLLCVVIVSMVMFLKST